MTRNLRKRHLATWLILLIAMVFLLAYATNNKPVFAGEQTNISSTK